MPTCKIHPDRELVCLACMGSKGGKRTAKVHGDKLAAWGERGHKQRRKKQKSSR